MSLPPHIRVRCADEHPLIFERPNAQSTAVRGAMMAVTWIGWAVWVSLWRPALTLLPWLFGADIARREWVEFAGWTDLVNFVLHTAPYGQALCAILLIWAFSSYLRFRGSDRRKSRPLSTAETDAKHTRMTAEALSRSRQSTNLVCYHDEEGHLTDVRNVSLQRPDLRDVVDTVQSSVFFEDPCEGSCTPGIEVIGCQATTVRSVA